MDTDLSDFNSQPVNPDDIRLAEQELIKLRQEYIKSLMQFLLKQHEIMRKETNSFKKDSLLQFSYLIDAEVNESFAKNEAGQKRIKTSRLKRIK